MFKYGFEREYFVQQAGKYVLVPAGVPYDACGFLAEARSEPHINPMKAVYLLLAEEADMKSRMPRGFKLKLVDTIELPAELLKKALQTHGKSALPNERGNLYGLDYDADDKLCRAGLHIHFSNIQEVERKDGVVERVPRIMNMPAIIQHFDRAFEKEIKDAKRLPGLYEMKAHGFEYRSLPASIDLDRVAEVLKSLNVWSM